jgi:hypothetical protein
MYVHQWRLLRGEWLIIMSGMELLEWYQEHGFHVFDTIKFTLLHSIPTIITNCPSLNSLH